MSAAPPHNAEPACAALAMLADLFDSPAMGEAYGEDISIRAHMLQCAELAVARGLGEEIAAAALLHDIGWGMGGWGLEGWGDDRHEHIAADLLEPLLGAAVAMPVRLHVAAKRYLVTTEPDYAARLSTASRGTLARQGGRMSARECAAFATEPHFASAIALRHIDDAGKDLRAPTTSFADYAPLLLRLMTHGEGDGEAGKAGLA